MFSAISERKMLSVRGVLLVAWFVLIASLFWDPFSIALTRPDALGSPFKISETPIMVQSDALTSAPYSMGTRLFWTMIVPILPLFLMVFGHEAWRRICPLSLASQIPGYLGLRRRRTTFERRTGLLKSVVPLINRNGWLERNSWYVQFGLLFVGIIARLLIINTDREALGIALLFVIGSAMVTGMLWGGKTWCNFFCPANVVQKIYTEPGGILESNPHFLRPQLPQSMCRKPTKKSDVSACVACKANCGDIDLQRSYWNGVTDLQRRNVYYMFFGLIIGFYGFYYLYSGSWDYYFSGLWTHEDNIRSKIMRPGLFLLGQTIDIPKAITAPLIMALACGTSLLLGRSLEALYRKYRSRDPGMTEDVIVHHCLSVCAWLSINAFYLFGGRPNILLLPSLTGRVIDITIVALTTIWLKKALQQSPVRYQQEGMAAGLLKQLKSLKLDKGALPDNRNIDTLRPSEIYLLAKVLPGFSQQQKLTAYRNMLEEQIAKGATGNQMSSKLLDDFRAQMGITEEDHNSLLDELGYSDSLKINTSLLTAEEKATSIAQYRSILENAVMTRVQAGATVAQTLEEPSVHAMLDMMRRSLQISDVEHLAAVDALVGEGIIREQMDAAVDAIRRHKSARLRLEHAEIYDPLGAPLIDLLLDHMEAREQTLYVTALSILRNFPPYGETDSLARDIATLAGPRLKLLLRQPVPWDASLRWRDVLLPEIMETFQAGQSSHEADETGQKPRALRHEPGNAPNAGPNLARDLSEIVNLEDPLFRGIGVTAFGYIAPDQARAAALDLLKDPETRRHSMLLSTAEYVAGVKRSGAPDAAQVSFRLLVETGEHRHIVHLEANMVTVGRGPDNDVVIGDPAVWTYHATLKAEHGEVRLDRMDEGLVFVNGHEVLTEPVSVTRNSLIQFGGVTQNAPRLTIDWENDVKTGDTLHFPPIHRLAILARNPRLVRLSDDTLATLALECAAERYRRGDRLEAKPGEARYFMVHQGSVKLFDPGEMGFVPGVTFGPGHVFGFEPSMSTSRYFPEIDSDHAILLHLPAWPEVQICAAATVAEPSSSRSVPVRRPPPKNGVLPQDI